MRYLMSIACACLLGLAAHQPAFAAEPSPGSSAVILILPFSTPSGSSQSWIGKAMQQDLEADLMQGTQARVIGPSDAPAASDSREALAAAHRLGASIVVFGQAQSNATEVRLTGQVLDVTNDKPFGPLKATGSSGDLFHLEDAIAGQTLAMLPRSLLSAQAARALSRSATSTQSPTPPQSAALPQVIIPPADNDYSGTSGTYATAPQPSNYSYAPGYSYAPAPDFYPAYEAAPSYGYAYPLPAYTYGYPYGDLFPFIDFDGVFIGGDFGFDHFRHGEGGRRDGFERGHGNGFAGRFGGGATFGNRGFSSAGASGRTFASPSFAHPGGFGGFRSAPRISGFSGGFHSGGLGGFRGGAFGGFRGGSFGGSHGGGGRR